MLSSASVTDLLLGVRVADAQTPVRRTPYPQTQPCSQTQRAGPQTSYAIHARYASDASVMTRLRLVKAASQLAVLDARAYGSTLRC